eukprot:scaffold49427_cov17-Tisochrysis_lutea.AAC.1
MQSLFAVSQEHYNACVVNYSTHFCLIPLCITLMVVSARAHPSLRGQDQETDPHWRLHEAQ